MQRIARSRGGLGLGLGLRRIGLACLIGWSVSAAALSPELQAERAALMRAGEAALAQGRAQSAVHRFERAVSLQHSADAEIALVRALMQGGQSVQAATYGAHTAGAHRQVVEGAVLYAWLLALSGQSVAAQRLLDDASLRFPGDAQVAALRAGALHDVDVRLRPFAVGVAVPAAAQVVSSGTLFDAGRQALVPLAALPAGASPRLWVRNGLGQAVDAQVARRLPGLGLAVLRLASALQARTLPRALGDEAAVLPWPEPVARDPFPGSPAHTLLYPAAPAVRSGEPAWPRLYPGFLGAVAGADAGSGGGRDPAMRRLGIDTPEGRRGGPVFDAAGRWSGVALGMPGQPGGWFVPMSALRQALGEAGLPPVQADAARAPPTPLPVEAIHEIGLRTAVQVLGLRASAKPAPAPALAQR